MLGINKEDLTPVLRTSHSTKLSTYLRKRQRCKGSMGQICRRFVRTTRALVLRLPLFTISRTTNIITLHGCVAMMICSKKTNISADAMESFTMVSLEIYSLTNKLISQLSESGTIGPGLTNCKKPGKNIQTVRHYPSEVTHGHSCQRPASVSQNPSISPANAPTKVRIACAQVTSTS
jgi:hypothetical protein